MMAAIGWLFTISPSYVAANGFWHTLHVAGNDACAFWGAKPGCDANFSAVALQEYDGSVSGRLMDRWWGVNGMRGVVECMVVQDNAAFVLGTITSEFAIGMTFFAAFEDNGTSHNDAPDRISQTFFVEQGDWVCDDGPYLLPILLESWMYDLTVGQVKIR